MDSQNQVSTVRYLKGNRDFKFFKDPLEETQSMFNYDLERIARDAMTYTAQRRTAELPAELRLEVMKASVLYHRCTKELEDLSKVENVEAGAVHLFDGEHIKQSDRAIYDALKEAADQAFLGHSIFTVHMDPGRLGLDLTGDLPEALLARIHYIHVCACMLPPEEHDRGLISLAEAWDSVKVSLPNLKACVLTLEVHTCDSEWSPRNLATHVVSDDITRFSTKLLKKKNPNYELGTVFAYLFEEFAEKFPASKCLVRMMHAHYDSKTRISQYNYGPLVSVEGAEDVRLQTVSRGERMLEQTYKLARTSEVQKQDRSDVHLWLQSEQRT